ncbi:MAG TPA: redox-regulated ATPase YchF [Chloroflexi bacterium]|jgi:ribosome-binding ATPase YchF (GTP1/OBG family)|nr:redox-regulated ATPase YchF [Chloroflexota bacterium]HAF19818.1 redox-regulated ATPase YchF [Chloroflexota bacterium]
MPVNVAIVGPAGSGKTTLFKALTAGRGADGVGMVDVPDERLQRLAEAVKPLKVTPAQVRVEDTPPGSRAQRVAFARQADVLVKVARCFGPDPQPAAELEEFALDLVLADLASVERRLELVAKEVRAGKKDAVAENEVLQLAKAHLDAGQSLRTLTLDREQRELLNGVFPVTLKPSVYVANAADELLPGGGEPATKVSRLAAVENAPAIVLSARLEAELGELEESEQAEMRASYGIDESGLGRIARAVWEAGGLITYFTAGEPEVRAWPCERDALAPVAAGKIHTDFEKHFIRAEVTSVDELVAAGSMEALRAAGKLRIEGREYRVKDGDVVFFRVGR